MMRDRTFVNYGLAIVFTGWIQPLEFKQAIGRRIEINMTDNIFNVRIINGERSVLNQSGIKEATLFGKDLEVIPVKSATETFTL